MHVITYFDRAYNFNLATSCNINANVYLSLTNDGREMYLIRHWDL